MPLRNEAPLLSPEEIQAYIGRLNEELEKAAKTLVSFEQRSAEQVGQALAEIQRTIHQLGHSRSYE